VRVLAAASIDVLEISGGTYENPVTLSGTGSAGGKLRGAERSAPRGRTAEREAYFLAFATKAREICPRPIMLTGGFRTLSAMSRAVADGSVDLVGLARPLARNPDLPRSLLAGHDARSHDLRRVGHKRIDALVDLRWHVAQLHRMAVGLDPDPALGRRAALMQAIWRLYGPA
jgi:2,4-dienoyl-CoA reductase-like NADH-dependent reductase (Old Yellow Enzyme family)